MKVPLKKKDAINAEKYVKKEIFTKEWDSCNKSLLNKGETVTMCNIDNETHRFNELHWQRRLTYERMIQQDYTSQLKWMRDLWG